MKILKRKQSVQIIEELAAGDKSLQYLTSLGPYTTIYNFLELAKKEPLGIIEEYEGKEGIMFRLALEGVEINFRPEVTLKKISKV